MKHRCPFCVVEGREGRICDDCERRLRVRTAEIAGAAKGTMGPHQFGGLGGIRSGRPIDETDPFECAVNRSLGARLREDGRGLGWSREERRASLGGRLWGSLANVEWWHENGDEASYSFRAAGDLVAAVVGSGDYMDWYCSGSIGHVDDEVLEALGGEGWRYRP